ncbi:MAG: hypothetical protein I3273_06250 [Candidatus Moeniiplasma glomeromycotorum]|nr:hypothetical protein [Candidatus Moeniiplasma glomeromycotorum]MCE8168018.1 hypothetical protein [Candidatus Moeniiplasma glomeromycotorum]MCE8169686.1 hypothetical protein [Candidatus Moeniiplasma glomeromycotorum]
MKIILNINQEKLTKEQESLLGQVTDASLFPLQTTTKKKEVIKKVEVVLENYKEFDALPDFLRTRAILTIDNKKEIFQRAKKISDQIIFWNTTEQKKLLNKELKEKVEYKINEGNKIDGLIVEELGSGGWQKDPEQLSDRKSRELFHETNEVELLISEIKATTNRVNKHE